MDIETVVWRDNPVYYRRITLAGVIEMATTHMYFLLLIKHFILKNVNYNELNS